MPKKKTLKIEIENGNCAVLVVPACWIKPIVTSLCSNCAGSIYDDSEYRIRRADMNQKVHDSCDRCGGRHAYDFVVFEKSDYKMR